MAAHARLSPSASERWMTCPGSVRLIERLVAEGLIDPDKPNVPADEGTAAHQVRADALTLGMDAWDFVGTTMTVKGRAYPCTDDVARFLQPGIDWIRAQDGNLIVEHKVDLSRWIPDGFGTLDVGIISLVERLLTINDLKFGFVPVWAKNSKQLRIYALGVLEYYDLWDKVDRVRLVIDQPRNGGMKYAEITVDDLLAFAAEVVIAVARVDEPDAPLVVSELGCEWCDVRQTEAGCPAYNAHMLELLDDGEMRDPVEITPERRWEIARWAPQAKKWLTQIVGDSIRAALAGNPDPGSKAVEGKLGDRVYTDEEAATALLKRALGEAATVTKPITPAQAGKLLIPTRKNEGDQATWDDLQELITRAPGKPILVPAEDSRPALLSEAGMLAELDDL